MFPSAIPKAQKANGFMFHNLKNWGVAGGGGGRRRRGSSKVLSEEEDYENQCVICGAVILAAVRNPIKSVSQIKQQISYVATHIFN